MWWYWGWNLYGIRDKISLLNNLKLYYNRLWNSLLLLLPQLYISPGVSKNACSSTFLSHIWAHYDPRCSVPEVLNSDHVQIQCGTSSWQHQETSGRISEVGLLKLFLVNPFQGPKDSEEHAWGYNIKNFCDSIDIITSYLTDCDLSEFFLDSQG